VLILKNLWNNVTNIRSECNIKKKKLEMKALKVIVCKAGKGISAHLPEVNGFVIASESMEKLRNDLLASLQFHFEGLYPEELEKWMAEPFGFEYVFKDIPALVEGYNGLISQSSLARISGINESQMRQYALGIKKPSKKIASRIEAGLKKYADELRSITFA